MLCRVTGLYDLSPDMHLHLQGLLWQRCPQVQQLTFACCSSSAVKGGKIGRWLAGWRICKPVADKDYGALPDACSDQAVDQLAHRAAHRHGLRLQSDVLKCGQA